MISFLVELIPLLIMIYKEYYSQKAQADAENQAFTLDQATKLAIVNAAVDKWNSANSDNSTGASNAWDAADLDAQGKSEPVIPETKDDKPSS